MSSLLGQEGFSNSVLGNTWSKSNTFFEGLHRDKGPAFAVLRKGGLSIPESAHYKTPYSYQLEPTQPILTNEAGSVHMARQNFWPILKRQALYTLRLTGTGMREPHWHPETAELGYVKKGKGRMSIYNPEGNVDTYVMEEGDIYFIPKAYPHHIENLEKDQPLDILVFFDQGMPADVGFSGSVRAFSNEVLGDITQTNPNFFEQLPMYYADLFIVNKLNDCTP